MIGTIVLIHATTAERKVVQVEQVTKTYVAIRWPMAGIYDLNLLRNVLTPRGSQGQARGKAKWYKKDRPPWSAEDIAAVRKMVADELAGADVKEETRKAMARHEETKPGGNPRLRARDIIHSPECECEACLTRYALFGY
jgi:hypothetical protein